jgi:hypothetical protein
MTDPFEIWWQKNKLLYGLVGVKKEVAKAIWNDVGEQLQKSVLQILKEHV